MKDKLVRFKIDRSARGGRYPIGLFVSGRWGWRELDDFETREEALCLYEKLKDLPEYL